MSDRMTIRQIASAAGCNHKTVRAAVERLYPDRARNGVRLDFNHVEAFSIMAELPKRNMVMAPSQNREASLPQNGKVRLSGALLRELRLSVKAGILRPTDPRMMLGLDTPPALPATDGLPADLLNKARATAAAVAESVIRREIAKMTYDAKQGRLAL